MRICLLSSEFFGWGTQGGFGYATRRIGSELARHGVEVSAVVPRPRGAAESSLVIDGIRVLSFPRADVLASRNLFRLADADVYHSQQPSVTMELARSAMPDRKHVATLRDPRGVRDWLVEFCYPTHSRRQVVKTLLFYENPLTRRAIRRADALFCPARFLIPKVKRMYRLARAPGFLPTPVAVPDRVEKAREPTVCFLGRLDRVKRPARFLDLVRGFPAVRFVVIGKGHGDRHERELRVGLGSRDNLEMAGYIDQFRSDRLSRHLCRSWILVNTSAKEALPNSFLEALAHGCAIISSMNPDRLTEAFGLHVADGDFEGALRHLLERDRWRERGRRGREYVRDRFEKGLATRRHLDEYRRILDR